MPKRFYFRLIWWIGKKKKDKFDVGDFVWNHLFMKILWSIYSQTYLC